MRTLAPAKVNWTLEVLGRRDDGFHEVQTVMQAVDVCDEVEATPAEELAITIEGPERAIEGDLVAEAARRLARKVGKVGGAALRVRKRIPLSAGLGGGSSDAGATLRLLTRLWRLGMVEEELAVLAAGLSSDVSFFLFGGTALAGGRGERVTPLPDAPQAWLVIVVPPLRIPEKTRRMYASLRREEFSDGTRTQEVVRWLEKGGAPTAAMIYNVFERAAYEVLAGLDAYRRALLEAGAGSVHLAGSGPALFCVASEEKEARGIAADLRVPAGADVFVARTLSRSESVWVGS